MPDDSVVLKYSRDGRAAHVRLNRPEKHNALDRVAFEQLQAAIAELDESEQVRVATVRDAGGTFSAGADLSELEEDGVAAGDRQGALDQLELIHGTLDALEAVSVPTVAVVEGYALAGGLELLMACDMAISSTEAQIGDQHANYGLVAGGGGTQRLPALVGERRAKELMFTGRYLDPSEAKEWGLVNRVAPPAELDDAVEQFVDELAEKSPHAAAITKHLVNRSRDLDLDAGLELERQHVSEAMFSEDAHEGRAAFEEGRDPEF